MRRCCLSGIIRHGESIYAEKKVFTVTPEGVEEATFFQISKRAEQLASALERLGISRGDRVATFMWNNQAHMEAYLAVPSMGAVLHTLNIRLFPEQLAFIINHAEDRVIIVDASLARAARARAGPDPTGRGRSSSTVQRRPASSARRSTTRTCSRRAPGVRVARARRTRRRHHVLHLRNDGQPQGGGLLTSLDLAALDGLDDRQLGGAVRDVIVVY